ncbi:MAG: hypothetical protein HS113_05195 [Verrucomicrobiales bacterium]|nr:hypothetical protein [Verrucomicrobiales bacterium]
MHFALKGYQMLGGIYLGGYAKSAGFSEAFNLRYKAHLLAFPATGKTMNPEALLVLIRNVFGEKGGGRYCGRIGNARLGVVDGWSFSEDYGRGTTTYAAWKSRQYVFLAVTTTKTDAHGTLPRLVKGERSELATGPAPQSLRRRSNVSPEQATAPNKQGGTEWRHYLIGGVVAWGVYLLLKRKSQ